MPGPTELAFLKFKGKRLLSDGPPEPERHRGEQGQGLGLGGPDHVSDTGYGRPQGGEGRCWRKVLG